MRGKESGNGQRHNCIHRRHEPLAIRMVCFFSAFTDQNSENKRRLKPAAKVNSATQSWGAVTCHEGHPSMTTDEKHERLPCFSAMPEHSFESVNVCTENKAEDARTTRSPASRGRPKQSRASRKGAAFALDKASPSKASKQVRLKGDVARARETFGAEAPGTLAMLKTSRRATCWKDQQVRLNPLGLRCKRRHWNHHPVSRWRGPP